jgi:very-short-patch-repair endonuclease
MMPKLRRRRTLRDAETLRLIADERREHPTRAERTLAAILGGLNEGALDGRFRREWVCGGRWIVDFYFPEVRLGIEVDGGYHRSTVQRGWDLFKDGGLESAGVTVLRLTNEEVYGDRERLLGKLRQAWRTAVRNARRTGMADLL